MQTPSMPPLTKEEEQTKNDLFAVLRNEDELGMVLRALVYIERILDEIILTQSKNRDFYARLDLRYEKKIYLALLLGLPVKMEECLKIMGSIRNKFAHDPKYKLTKKHIGDLFAALSEPQRAIIEDSIKREKSLEDNLKRRFSLCAITIHAFLAGRLKAMQVLKEV
jgi:hypothetical protein